MESISGNIFEEVLHTDETEVFTSLFKSDFIKIEKINGIRSYSEPGNWYDQQEDEWVVLLRGNAEIEFANKKIITLNAGDYIFIQAHKLHRIRQTSESPECLWLAIHGKLK